MHLRNEHLRLISLVGDIGSEGRRAASKPLGRGLTEVQVIYEKGRTCREPYATVSGARRIINNHPQNNPRDHIGHNAQRL